MWSTWSETAKSSITSALEKTGDVITKAATSARPGVATEGVAGRSARGSSPPSLDAAVAEASADQHDEEKLQQAQQQLLKNLQVGWSSVLESTKAGIKVAQEKIEEEQTKLSKRIHKARTDYFYKRDLDLPLDVPALKDAEVVYLTDRLITMSHPAMASTTNPDVINAERKLAAIGHMLKKRHDGRFLVWNLSEVEYDNSILDDQVLTFSFPGSPSPPLGLLLKLLISIESWLKADDRNVAVVHCLTGKGRTSAVMAAFLCWVGEAGFSDIYDALAYIASCKHLAPEELTIPSQRRYASYFKNMLDSVRPSQPPLMLKRVIMSEAPRFARGAPAATTTLDSSSKDGGGGGGDISSSSGVSSSGKKPTMDDETQSLGCVPYLQVFKAGKLLQTASPLLSGQQQQQQEEDNNNNSREVIPFCHVSDGSISFHVNQLVQGDILIRCRHLTANNRQRISMFRAAFHTGYVPPKVMRLTKSQLDGACNDPRFPDDFFLDLIFEPADIAEAASNLTGTAGDAAAEEDTTESGTTPSTSTTTSSEQQGSGSDQAIDHTPPHTTTTVRASADDAMLHRDSRFWQVLATRREKHDAKAVASSSSAAATTKQDDPDNNKDDPLWGPTVGRRREFGPKNKRSSQGASGKDGGQAGKEQKAALETFSIGGEFDFLPEDVEPEQQQQQQQLPKEPKKDSLMEALMGVLSDKSEEDHESEEIIFDHDDDVGKSSKDTSVEPVVLAPTIVQLPPLPSQTETPTLSSETPSPLSTGEITSAAPEASQEKPSAPAQEAASESSSSELDSDIDALLAAGVDDLNLSDDDLLAVDDADLEDMESFLSSNTRK